MCARRLACPLCSHPGFLSLDALRAALVSVASRPLACPICNQLLLGIDKFTIHLFGHTINNSSNNKTHENHDEIVEETAKMSDTCNSNRILNLCTIPLQWNVHFKPSNSSNENNIAIVPQKNSVPNNQLIYLQPGQKLVENNAVAESTWQDCTIKTSDASQNHHETYPDDLQNEPTVQCVNCDICGARFPPKNNILELHKQMAHTVPDKKSKLDKEEKSLSHLSEHFFKNHYPCTVCGKVFKMKGSLMVHTRVANHHDTDSSQKIRSPQETSGGFNCPTCGKNFKKEQHVVQHLKTHEGKQWECDVCCKLFTTKYFLKKHKRLHSGEMPYKCNICEKTFTFQQSYHKHRLYHKDDKPHACATCGRSFKELSTLHNHERIHTGEKPFACETCGKCFRQRVSYLVHRRIHTGVMPYKCTMCWKSFRYKVSQRTHKCPLQTNATSSLSETPQNEVTEKIPESTSVSQNVNSNLHENGLIFMVNPNILTHQSLETISENEAKQDEKIASNDLFSMVLSPLENDDLSSPSTEMEHLRLSSPVDLTHNFVQNPNNPLEIIDDSFEIMRNETNAGLTFENDGLLETINQESLKELLYGMDGKFNNKDLK